MPGHFSVVWRIVCDWKTWLRSCPAVLFTFLAPWDKNWIKAMCVWLSRSSQNILNRHSSIAPLMVELHTEMNTRVKSRKYWLITPYRVFWKESQSWLALQVKKVKKSTPSAHLKHPILIPGIIPCKHEWASCPSSWGIWEPSLQSGFWISLVSQCLKMKRTAGQELGPDYDAKFWSFEKSFENFLNKTITKIFKGLF